MNLDKLSYWPSPKRLTLLTLISLTILFISYFIMNYFHSLTNDPVTNIFESQLSFNAEFMRWQYATMGERIKYYRWVAIIDYGFMVGYGLLIFCLALSIARKFPIHSKSREIGFVMSLFGFIAACLDALENVFILAMLSDPTGFPEFLAISHSSFALVKWTLGFIAVFYILIAFLYYLIPFRKR
ncbi:MAG: hypothetical protein ACTSR8_08780 [Promethearchaeota archaeon]